MGTYINIGNAGFQSARIGEILRKQYPAKLAEYSGELLLVGINYDKEQKTHQCRMVKLTDKEQR